MNKKRCTGCIVTAGLLIMVSLCSVVSAASVDKHVLLQKFADLRNDTKAGGSLSRLIMIFIGFLVGVVYMWYIVYFILLLFFGFLGAFSNPGM